MTYYPRDEDCTDMITVIVPPGMKLSIKFANTDGEFIVDFDSEGNNELTITADLPDSEEREGMIYREVFGTSEYSDVAEEKD